MEQLTLLAEKIVNDCKIILNDKTNQTPNIQIVKVILGEFEEILYCIKTKNKIQFLNHQKELWSNKVIIDSADYTSDFELFDMVRSFQKLAKCMNESQCLYQFS